MIRRYMIRSASRMQCSPAIGVAVCLVALGITIYVYRRAIIETIITTLLILGAVLAVAAVVVLVVSSLRWYGRQDRAWVPPVYSPDAVPQPTEAEVQQLADAAAIADPDAAALARDADYLAGSVVLAFSPDGKTLVAKDE